MSRTILVVDDHQLMINIIKHHLSQSTFKVLEAPDGDKALEIITQPQCKVDLIITDLHMPNLNGIELANTLRKLEYSLPIILMTSDMDAKTQFHQDKKYKVFNDFLIKPVPPKELLDKVGWLLNSDNP